MKRGEYVPERGDIVWLDFAPQSGHEQTGRRSALVLSPSIYNKKTGLALFSPITSKIKNYPFEVAVKERFISGVVLSDQIKSLDWRARNADFICKMKKDDLETVISLISAILLAE